MKTDKKIFNLLVELYWKGFDDARVEAFGKPNGETDIVKILKDEQLEKRRGVAVDFALHKIMQLVERKTK